jgi:Family of unknown function (DUF5719)
VILRRLPILALTVVGLGALVIVGRDSEEPVEATFATVPGPWMPAASSADVLTRTWFCPGVPAGGEANVAGAFVVANDGASEMTARVTLMGGPDQAVEQDITVPPYETLAVDAAVVSAPYVSAMVEIDGGGGVVEQRAQRPSGDSVGVSVAPCTTQTSDAWYLAEGFTAGGAVEQLILTNPYDDVAIVDIGFATAAGSRQPAQLQGKPIQPHSVEVIDLATIAARDEAEVAVKVEATFGELVVGRAQVYQGEGRLGYGVGLAAPALRSQWWFANGDKGEGITERYSLYNPTEDDVEVQPTFLGIPQGTDLIDPIVVPARQVVTYSSDDVAGLPDGRHAVVFATTDVSQSIVAERVITRTIDEVPTTSVVLGAVSRPEDGFVANTWTTVIGPGEATEDALVVYNIEAADAVVTVQAVTPAGIVTVPSLEALPLPAGGLLAVPLTEADVLDNQLIIRSTSQVFIERSLPREPGAQGRVGSWAIPVVG